MMNSKPLAEQLRPSTLEEYIGQEHLVGEGTVLQRALENNQMPSIILWGPPGVGKTTLALLIAQKLNFPFYMLSATGSGVKDVREVIDKAQKQGKSILFIDEIHRFNKAQQDSLLSAVEKGSITLIGATTENPSFEVISALLSRCQVYILKPLEETDLLKMLQRGVNYIEETTNRKIELLETDALIRISGGDARKLLNALELVCSQSDGNMKIDNALVLNVIQQNLAFYDKSGEMHYDIISAFIKSMRGSDPNGAIYWLARLIAGGEDPLFIARRMVILASEDIGNANPNALLLANACFDAVNKIGYPECRIVLSQTAVYLATSAKSNASYMAINQALELVQQTGDLPVPLHLRNSPTKLMKNLGYGKDYLYAHNYEHNFIEQEFLPDAIKGQKFYEPGNNSREAEARRLLKHFWKEKYNY